ncbi:hypothetical protein KVR01_007493 [Diaporthe batatas]|uniref:uncharacterized protein n=1 Tax=Diaporthe batatas TaxID=748121 RepID=UPI001D057B00|nr:uncharacterized protein KVR01_007493 [Diaporthe batatas]KAG8163015.1 hypothetical protein KVR01_007493 [Diaporthe batatas]
MDFVWNESVRHAHAMTRHWTSTTDASIPDIQRDMETLTLNVLASAAFHESYDFNPSWESDALDSATQSYRDALFVVHKHAIHLMLIPYHILTGSLMPKGLARIGKAAVSLKDHMTKMVRKERLAMERGEPGSGGLVTQLVRDHLETLQADLWDMPKAKKGTLSNEEIMGNLFVMTFAGYDTTAIALSFAMTLLAGHPDVQEWLSEEIITVTENKPVESWTYDLFLKLKRCRAVFLETMRLYGPITGLPKVATDRTQPIRVGDRVLAIPQGTETILLLHSAQTDPRYWPGGDPHAWSPSRWICRREPDAEPACEELFVPKRGSFSPWSDGPQGCVGKKFAEVEAVAALACVLKDCRIRPKLGAGETLEQGEQRAKRCANDVNYQLMLRMNDPSQAKLECKRV